MIDQIEDNYEQAGFRLQYLEVLNWGTFNKVRWQIQPDGKNALLTGDIGSGKSTLVDALTCLLVPHNKIIFNKAAGAEGKERNLLSYVRGEYKKEKEEITKVAKKVYLRPDDNTYSVIIGGFQNEGFSETISLAQFFWIGKDGKIDKLLIISPTYLSIKDHFSNFSDVNDLKKRLRGIPGLELFNDNFTQYSEHFRRLFGMNSEKAIDLFYQTVSMKAVTSLTTFVREQMLEKTDVKEQISILLKRFDDLNKAHAAVVNAREQYQILKPLVESAVEYGEVIKQIKEIEEMLEVMPAWFAERKIALLEADVLKMEESLTWERDLVSQFAVDLNGQERKRKAIERDIEHNGGSRIEQIGAEIKSHSIEKEKKRRAFDEYETFILGCGLDKINDESDFNTNIKKADAIQEQFAIVDLALREKRDNVISDLRRVKTEYKNEEEELRSLKARKTQIPGWLIDFRMQLCEDLEISVDDLPFAGELLQVNEHEKSWQGAIERLLHDLGISLLVPSSHYKSVSHYINSNPLQSADGRGIKLTFIDAGIHQVNQVKNIADEDSVIWKVDIKPDTGFYDWLEVYLQRTFGDFVCTDVAGLSHVPYGITAQGLIKSGRIRHTKDDRKRLDDKRNYVLGWSNLEKIKTLQMSVDKLAVTIHDLELQKLAVEKEQEGNNNSKLAIDRVLRIKEYSVINWKLHVVKIQELEEERRLLLHNSSVLDQLQKALSEVEHAISTIKEKEKISNEKIGELKAKLDNHAENIQQATLKAQTVDLSLQRIWGPILDEKIPPSTLSVKNIDNRQDEFRKYYYSDNGELRRLRGRQGGFQTAIEKRMREIKEHSKAEYSELGETVDARHEYMKKYENLAAEDLKRHEERFKDELNKNVINSISVFDNQLQKHEKDIKQKIKTINQHLSEIVYNAVQDTYITIIMDATVSKEVRMFREELRKCYMHSFGNNTDLYTEEKYEQVKRILDRFASMDNVDREWTSIVTDVRQWFEFNASERYRSDESEKEFYEGSGGKSGGQKEKLAYTILASALAYQFGLQFGETKSRSFRFVVIDEAFGRGSDDSTRYGLELFRKLNLQLLIVTPLQKIHVIESHVNSFHYISNRDGQFSQISNFTKKEYEMEKQKRDGVFHNQELS